MPLESLNKFWVIVVVNGFGCVVMVQEYFCMDWIFVFAFFGYFFLKKVTVFKVVMCVIFFWFRWVSFTS